MSKEWVGALLIAIMISLGGYLVVKQWNTGKASEDWESVCVKGQLVYMANFAQKAVAVNALSDDGNRVSCIVE